MTGIDVRLRIKRASIECIFMWKVEGRGVRYEIFYCPDIDRAFVGCISDECRTFEYMVLSPLRRPANTLRNSFSLICTLA